MEKEKIQERFQRIKKHLDEKSLRLWCANEAISIGSSGISLVSNATGVSRRTITEGVKEIKGEKELPTDSMRREGGGRKLKIEKDKELRTDIEKLIESSTRGNPETPLKWTSKSTREIADELSKIKQGQVTGLFLAFFLTLATAFKQIERHMRAAKIILTETNNLILLTRQNQSIPKK